MWHDNETTVDYLNFGVVADACTNLLQQADGSPISIGVSGGWGVGKSSLVRMIAERLDIATVPGDNTYVVVTFNPWLYQDFEGARSALLQLVGDEVLRRAASDEAIFKKAKRLLQRINLLRLVQMGGEVAATIATGIPVGAIGRALFKVGSIFGPDEEAKEGGDAKSEKTENDTALLKPAEPVSLPSEIQAFRDALEELLRELKITLVVFVDDLDRCLPKTAISTLESIRLLLFLKRSAFVIAADNEFIRGAVRVHFEGTGITSDIATNYFDKLIQVPLHVPRLGVNEAKGYLALLLLERANKDNEFDSERFKRALAAVPERLRTSWRGDAVTTDFLHSLVDVGDSRMVGLMDLAEGLAPLLTQSSAVNANPRLMKRFLNTVYLRSALAKPQDIELDIRALAKWHLVERCDETLANALAALVTSALDGRVDVLRLAEAAALDGTALPELFKNDFMTREWLQLHPALGETDLRPLLHLSRDTATRDFGADDLTSEGRALRDAFVVVTSANEPLTQAIRSAGSTQARLAMGRAWQIKAPKRTWKRGEDIVMLVESCKVFPELSADASVLLAQAPVSEVGPGIIPTLYEQTWSHSVIDTWEKSSTVATPVKNAIKAKKAR
ncbi:Predicted P-loop ATPase, KAP-like [Rhodoferax sp. OV413]|uniref:KAP family P-loop NTPase fold protein n=1 Tax=Rhodoferax sp. OV413 TaxID=1855285 RepID=UPI0008871115|nr:P-loop NTPase fold protein [Rhodoferax sp. OV413]SDP92944.1 Predicted P-loop ATPase, KAP-like [Rhodoferax sp. OV413]